MLLHFVNWLCSCSISNALVKKVYKILNFLRNKLPFTSAAENIKMKDFPLIYSHGQLKLYTYWDHQWELDSCMSSWHSLLIRCWSGKLWCTRPANDWHSWTKLTKILCHVWQRTKLTKILPLVWYYTKLTKITLMTP